MPRSLPWTHRLPRLRRAGAEPVPVTILGTLAAFALAATPLALGACGGDDGKTDLPPLFEPKPECMGDAIAPFMGVQQQVISSLGIGSTADGFDLDGDGDPDNKLAGIGALASGSIDDSFADYSLLIPMEMFDFPNAAVDDCVKFALYLGDYKTDGDNDGKDTAVAGGDCNDHDATIHPGAAEIAGNFKDDDCDGKADELDDNTPSNDTMDRDHDGVTIADGDCDDTEPTVKGPGFPEICGDGLDNDCDGVADRNPENDECNPYDATPDKITVNPLSFDGGKPVVQFTSGDVKQVGDKLQLTAGPSLFSVAIPVSSDITLTLKITGTTIQGDVVKEGDRVTIQNGRLGGVIDARTADTIRGLSVDAINLKPEDSLLDAIFAGPVGIILALPSLPAGTPHEDCRTPDIDVDRDGLEAFCDTNSDGDPNTKVVDLCIDGDGTEVRDEVVNGVTKHCTEAVDANGKPRFVDGISVELNFTTAPADLVRPPS
ncbi:MAG TPA: putative metal-binding motif-containing protein [Kofleriaceae bacterium]|nr:putative metal-binding motif-containing protein [Kofleriaceae bacterium]